MLLIGKCSSILKDSWRNFFFFRSERNLLLKQFDIFRRNQTNMIKYILKMSLLFYHSLCIPFPIFKISHVFYSIYSA